MIKRPSYLRSSLAFLIGATSASYALAQDYSVCQSVILSGLREYNISSSSHESLDRIYDNYCGANGSSSSSTFNVGLDAVVKAIPIKFTDNAGSTQEAFNNFCKNYQSVRQEASSSSSYSETIVREAYKTFENCLDIVRNGVSVKHNIVNIDTMTISFKGSLEKPVQINGIQPSRNVTCKGQNTLGAVVTYELGTREKSSGWLNVSCSRSADAGLNGQSFYREGTIQVATNNRVKNEN